MTIRFLVWANAAKVPSKFATTAHNVYDLSWSSATWESLEKASGARSAQYVCTDRFRNGQPLMW